MLNPLPRRELATVEKERRSSKDFARIASSIWSSREIVVRMLPGCGHTLAAGCGRSTCFWLRAGAWLGGLGHSSMPSRQLSVWSLRGPDVSPFRVQGALMMDLPNRVVQAEDGASAADLSCRVPTGSERCCRCWRRRFVRAARSLN